MDQIVTSKKKSVCILVLGMHRSGTSAVTRIIGLAGAKLPNQIMGRGVGNERGHWEPERLVTYHDELLAELGSCWHDWRPLPYNLIKSSRKIEIEDEVSNLIKADFADACLFVLKEPRICRFAPLFIDALTGQDIDVRIVLPLRNPIEVIESLEERDGFPKEEVGLLWLRHVLESEASSRGCDRVFTTYDDIHSDWRKSWQQISFQLNIEWPYKVTEIESQVDQFIDPKLRHHNYTLEDVLLNPELSGWISETYTNLLVLKQNPKSEEAMKRLDDISHQFNSAIPALSEFSRSLKSARRERLDLSSKLEARAKELNAKQSEFEQATSDLEKITQELDEANRKALAQQEEIGQLTKARNELSVLNLERGKELEAQFSRVSNLTEVVANLEDTASKLTGERDELAAQFSRVSNLTEVVANLEDTVSKLTDERDELVEVSASVENSFVDLQYEFEQLTQTRDELSAKYLEYKNELDVKVDFANKQEQVIESLRKSMDQAGVEQERLNATLAERDQQISDFRNSTSWRITGPLRSAKYVFDNKDYGLGSIYKYLYSKLGKILRSSFPLNFVEGIKYRVPSPDGVPRRLQHRKSFDETFGSIVDEIKIAPHSAGAIRDIFIFSIISFGFRVQRPQHIAEGLARRGGRVFYIEMEMAFKTNSIECVAPNLYVVRFAQAATGHIHPYTGKASKNQIDAWISEFYSFCDHVKGTQLKEVIVQHPFWWQFVSHLPPQFRIVYDCMDNISGFDQVDENLVSHEHELVEQCDQLIVSSEYLMEKYEKLNQPVLIRNAGQIAHFDRPNSELNPPVYLAKNLAASGRNRRRVGYVGAIANWFDADLLRDVARLSPDKDFHLAGEVTCPNAASLENEKNIFLYGEITYDDVPSFLAQMDVLIIPFKINPLILACDPVKFYEYCGLGKPTVVTPMPELDRAKELTFVADGPREFSNQLDIAINAAKSETYSDRLRSYARSNTWENRTDKFVSVLDVFPKVSIIILSYGDVEITKSAIHSLFCQGGHYPNMEVLVVDNGSSRTNLDELYNYCSGFYDLQIIENGKNLGFAGGNNVGLKAATGDYVLLLNNDTYLAPGAILAMVRHLRQNSFAGAVGPLTNNIGNEAKTFVEYSTMDEMCRVARKITTGYRNQYLEVKTLAYFAVMFRKRDLKLFGMLSEEYGRGMFEDDDHCEVIKSHGYKCVIAEDAFVHHHLSATFSEIDDGERSILFERNRRIFEARWGKWVPHKYREERFVAQVADKMCDNCK